MLLKGIAIFLLSCIGTTTQVVVQADGCEEAAPANPEPLKRVAEQEEGRINHPIDRLLQNRKIEQEATSAPAQAVASESKVGTVSLLLSIAQDWAAEICILLCCCQA